MFAADAFRLSDAQADLIDKARGFGKRVLAPRAAQHDRDATFPIENFRDMRGEGLLSICIPKANGGSGADFQTYCIAAAELGRYCGATALSWNMHVCSTLWSGPLADDLPMSPEDRAAHNARVAACTIVALLSMAPSMRSRSRRAAPPRPARSHSAPARPVEGGLSSPARRFSPRSRAPRTTTACCAPNARGVRRRQPAQHALSRHSR
jgi:hypothetical protein